MNKQSVKIDFCIFHPVKLIYKLIQQRERIAVLFVFYFAKRTHEPQKEREKRKKERKKEGKKERKKEKKEKKRKEKKRKEKKRKEKKRKEKKRNLILKVHQLHGPHLQSTLIASTRVGTLNRSKGYTIQVITAIKNTPRLFSRNKTVLAIPEFVHVRNIGRQSWNFCVWTQSNCSLVDVRDDYA